MRIYISGAISGLPALNRPMFNAAEIALRAAGFDPVYPHQGEVPGWSWEDYMVRALVLMLTCDAIALLPGWAESRGARLEADVAISVGMAVAGVGVWLALGPVDVRVDHE